MPQRRVASIFLGILAVVTIVVVVGLSIDLGATESNAAVLAIDERAGSTTTTGALTTTTTVAPPTTTEAPTTTTTVTSTTTTEAPTTTTTVAPTTTTRAPTTTTRAPTTTVPPTTTTQAPTTTVAASEGSFNSSYESDFRGRINGLRSKALKSDSSLNSYARNWARHMAESNDFSHSNIGSLLGPWSTVGENISMGYSVGAMFDGLRGSSGHYANMVNESFTHVGVGAWVQPDGSIWTAHVFAG